VVAAAFGGNSVLPRVFDIIAGAITVVWVVAVLVGVLDPSRQANPALYALMTAVVGAYAGARIMGAAGTHSRREDERYRELDAERWSHLDKEEK
jgi:hypothetical protein